MMITRILPFATAFLASAAAAHVHGQGANPDSLERDLRDLAAEVLRRPEPLPVRHWKMAPVYDGLLRLSRATGDPRYLAEVLRFGDMAGWHPQRADSGAPGLVVGATWLRVARMDPEQAYRAAPTLAGLRRLESVAGDPGRNAWLALPSVVSAQAWPGADPADALRIDLMKSLPSREDSALAFLTMALALEARGGDARAFDSLEQAFRQRAEHLAGARDSRGFWPRETLAVEGESIQDLTPSAVVVLAYAVGLRQGLLEQATYLPLVLETTAAVSRAGLDLDRHRPWEMGLFLAAGAEVLGLVREAAVPYSDPNLLRRAEEIYREPTQPRAWALYVPRRKDDLAWENDRMAFRIYGPALRESSEGSGVDAWIKRVRYPIAEKWYRLDFAGEKSYHDDSGEGYDGYKVGPRRGCGGAGLWQGDKLLASNVYDRFEIYWTAPREAAFSTWYTYPNGIEEEKRFSLRLGGEATRVRSIFTRGGEPVADLTIGVGLSAQTGEHVSAFDPQSGRLSLTDTVGNDRLETFVRWASSSYPEAEETAIGSGKKKEHLVLLTTDAEGRVEYEFGFDLL